MEQNKPDPAMSSDQRDIDNKIILNEPMLSEAAPVASVSGTQDASDIHTDIPPGAATAGSDLLNSPESAIDAVNMYCPGPEDDTVSQEVMNMYFPDSMKETDPEVIEKLSLGLLSEYLPQLQKSKSTLSEVSENQKILIETIQQENSKFAECQSLQEVTDLMNKAKLYHNKLVNIKKDMSLLHDRSTKLKKRALKLQQQKQKEALLKEQQRDRELEKERQLVAKPAKKGR